MISVIDSAIEPGPGWQLPPVPKNPDRLHALRHLILEKFPVAEKRSTGVLRTGWEVLDASEGGLHCGGLTEISGSCSAGTLFLEMLLQMLEREKCFAALVDGGHSFTPEDYSELALERLLWVWCDDAREAIKAADLLLRDGNLSLVVLDLQVLSTRERQRIPASTWHRFQRLVEQSNMVFAVLSPEPMVEGAAVRIAVHNVWDLRAMRLSRAELMARMEVQVFTRSQFGRAVLEDASEWLQRSA